MTQMPKTEDLTLLMICQNSGTRTLCREYLDQLASECKAVSETNDIAFGLKMTKEQSYDCVIVDFALDTDIEAYLKKLQKASPDTAFLCLVDEISESKAVSLCYEGLMDYQLISFLSAERLWLKIQSVRLHKWLSSKVESQKQQMQHIARHDSLTGLPNRVLFKETIKREISFAARHQSQFSLLFLDLDNFKTINDSLGHLVGDMLLKEVAKRLELCLRADDFIARLGGDEFAIILREGTDLVNTQRVAKKIIDSLKLIYRINGKNILTTMSIGIAEYPRCGEDFSTLLKNADLAMYQAKAKGRNNFQFHTPELSEKQQQRLVIETELGFAIKRQELRLVYQPKYDLNQQKMIGIEALLRWQNRKLGDVAPTEFIPVAEATGLINQIGMWVLEKACQDFAERYTQQVNTLGEDFRVSVNLSAKQLLQDNFIYNIEKILDENSLKPHHLEFELTETDVLNRSAEADSVLKILKTMGIVISIDDFGTGYALIGQLSDLPINTLKIALPFVQKIKSVEDNNAKIVKAIINLAHNLGLNVIAEGVETETQFNFLRENNCTNAQGYYFSQPVSVDEIDRIISDENPEADAA